MGSGVWVAGERCGFPAAGAAGSAPIPRPVPAAGLVDRSGTDAEQQGPDQDADHDPWLPHAREHRVVWVNPTYPVAGLPQPGRTLVVGVVNVTPDSFSDGGKWFDPDAAVAHGLDLLDQGADIVDVGGESTRPGAVRPPLAEELRRVMPVVHRLVEAGAVVSVDTMRTAVVTEAVAAGAKLVNDVSGGQADPQMFATIGRLGVPYVCMHWRGHSADMQSRASYADVVSEVVAELREPDRRGAAGRHRSGTADPRSRCRLRQDRRAQLGAPAPVRRARASSAARCWSGSRASGFSAPCWPTHRATRGHRRAVTTRPRL